MSRSFNVYMCSEVPFTRIYTHKYTNTCVQALTHTHASKYACPHTSKHTHTLTPYTPTITTIQRLTITLMHTTTYTMTHSKTYTCMCTRACARIYLCVNTYTFVHTPIQSNTNLLTDILSRTETET